MGMGPIIAVFEQWMEAGARMIERWLLEPVGMTVDAVPYLALFALFCVLRLENQRWVMSRLKVFMKEAGSVGAFVDLTAAIGLLFGLGFIGAVWFDQGMIPALVTLAAGALATAFWAWLVANPRVRGLTWVAGTALIWPVMYALTDDVTWFGRYHI